MKRPTVRQCRDLLEQQADPAVPPYAWRILGIPYTGEDAIRLAELCILTHRDLSPVVTASLMLDLARRLADLEEVVARVPRRPGPQSGVAQPSDGSWI